MSWIKCSERMPPYGVKVIAFSKVECALETQRARTDETGEHWWCDYLVDLRPYSGVAIEKFRENTVTHWQPLPSPPEGEE